MNEDDDDLLTEVKEEIIAYGFAREQGTPAREEAGVRYQRALAAAERYGARRALAALDQARDILRAAIDGPAQDGGASKAVLIYALVGGLEGIRRTRERLEQEADDDSA